jgi:hypothetical protein
MSESEQEQKVEERAANVVVVFGDELRLIRPKGISGLRFMRDVQRLYKKAIDLLGPYEKRTKGKSEIEITSETLGLMIDLMDDDFIDTAIPALYLYSTMGLKKSEVIARIEDEEISSETIAHLFEAFFSAMAYWATSEDPATLEEAQKK